MTTRTIVDHSETIAALQQAYGKRVITSLAIREQHGRDVVHTECFPPDAVIFPASTEEVSEIVEICAAHNTPIIPFGAGTSLEGHFAAIHGGVCIDLSQMDEVIEVNETDLDCRVQAGVTREQLNTHLRDTGLFFPIDPGANASIGGMAATRASGTNAVRYGTMRENVLGLTVVTSDGKIIKTGRRARKSSAGYDLTGLFVGSEGTLGVITEIQLRLYGIPEAISSAVCAFDDLAGAIDTVILAIQMGIPVARIELLDDVQMDAVNRHSNLNYAVKPTLFFEFHGTDTSVREQAGLLSSIANENGGADFKWAMKTEERNALWRARHDAFWAAKELRPGTEAWATDVCVPISKLAHCILEAKKDILTSGLIAPIVGHVGDGNFHLIILVDVNDPDEVSAAHELNTRLVKRAQSCGGTCTGEHGIGYGKLQFMEAEHGPAVDIMRNVKQALDPQGIMNPGKTIPRSSNSD